MAGTKADDGMDLGQSYIFDSASETGLPSADTVKEKFGKVIDQVLALRAAPVVEPYTGPAILLNRASGVFFHEIFGHRIEGHRQKDVEEGQTFTKMIGQAVLPEFLSVVDDPTQARFKDEDLRGFYRYDDEGVRAQPVNLVEKGVLKTFLLSRSPVSGFDRSNGHGRREPGRQVVSRQGNLMVHSAKTVPYEELRKMLVESCRKQSKPYGYVFEDITGGFTMTSRGGPQAFKVLPVVVYRVYADGRPMNWSEAWILWEHRSLVSRRFWRRGMILPCSMARAVRSQAGFRFLPSPPASWSSRSRSKRGNGRRNGSRFCPLPLPTRSKLMKRYLIILTASFILAGLSWRLQPPNRLRTMF